MAIKVKLRFVLNVTTSVFTLILLSACSSVTTGQLFSSYSQELAATRQVLQSGQVNQAIKIFPMGPEKYASNVLTQLEYARMLQLTQDYELSKREFEKALVTIDEQNFAAKVQISEGIKTTASFLTNDNIRDYKVPYFEQTMAHTLQALNFVSLNQVESALVEVRKANLVQQQALKLNRDELENAAIQSSVSLNDLYSRYPLMDELIGSTKNGFQNAFTFYLSGFLYEAAGDYNAAYIDYKRAIDIYPDNTYLQQDVLRLAHDLGFSDELSYFESRFNTTLSKPKGLFVPVLILIEQGLVPSKTESRVDLPIYTSRNDIRFYSIALPSYENTQQRISPISIAHDGQSITSEAIVKLSSLAAKDLKDRMPGIVARQIARLVAKEEFRQSAARNGGDIGNIIATLYNLASERADTRSWLTLANNYQIAKKYLPSGQHTLELSLNGVRYPVSFSTTQKRPILIRVVNLGSTLTTTVSTI